MFDLKDLMSRVNLPQDITRRGFLQVATVTAAFAAMNQARAQTGAQPTSFWKHPSLIVGDPSLCVDCQRCEMACTEFNDGKNDRFWLVFVSAAILVRSATRARPLQAFGATALSIRTPAVSAPTLSLVLMPARRVPSASTPDRARYVDEDKCIGCGLCQKACPWDMMSFDREKQKASKCFLCDGEPKCVKACPAAALTYMPWKDRSGEPARRPTHAICLKKMLTSARSAMVN